MRIAIVSDIHDNLTALEAVLADLRETAPDVVFHGGDIAGSGSRPVEVVDRIRDLGWRGVFGNTDELLFRPESLPNYSFAPIIEEMASWTREKLGSDRLKWLRALPFKLVHGKMALVHASPESCWKAPTPEEKVEPVYLPLGKPIAVYGHIHRPFIRSTFEITVANSGSVSMSYDGDRRASYLLLDDSTPTIRRSA